MRPRLTAEQLRVKLQDNVVVDPESGCWNWQKSKGSHGYGLISTGSKRQELCHRVSFEVFHREPTKGLVIMHSCDNRQCCNPEHLSEGTYTDNLKDAINKGRKKSPSNFRGSSNGMSKLTEGEVERLYLERKPYKQLATEFGVSVHTVSMIKGGKRWRHVTSMLNVT